MPKKSVLPCLIALCLFALSPIHAQQYYLNLTGSYKSTNQAGVLVTTKMTPAGTLSDIFPDPLMARGHALIFDIESGEVRVINKATGENLGAWYVLTVDTSVSSGDGSKSEVYWTISCPSDAGFVGSAVGTVQVTRGTENEITKFKMTGRFTLRYQPDWDASPRVYNGVFTTGARYVAPAQ